MWRFFFSPSRSSKSIIGYRGSEVSLSSFRALKCRMYSCVSCLSHFLWRVNSCSTFRETAIPRLCVWLPAPSGISTSTCFCALLCLFRLQPTETGMSHLRVACTPQRCSPVIQYLTFSIWQSCHQWADQALIFRISPDKVSSSALSLDCPLSSWLSILKQMQLYFGNNNLNWTGSIRHLENALSWTGSSQFLVKKLDWTRLKQIFGKTGFCKKKLFAVSHSNRFSNCFPGKQFGCETVQSELIGNLSTASSRLNPIKI